VNRTAIHTHGDLDQEYDWSISQNPVLGSPSAQAARGL